MNLVVREAFMSFRRTPSLSFLSIITIGFALFVVSLFGLVALNFQEALEDVGERVEVVMYLTRGTPETIALAAYDDILTFPEVESVEFVSADEALVQAREELVEFQGLYSDLSTNPSRLHLESSSNRAFATQKTSERWPNAYAGFALPRIFDMETIG